MFNRLISLLLLPFWCLHAWRHGVKHQQTDYLAFRLASRLPAVNNDLLWFHASSVGEVEALSPLVKHYLEANRRILFTCFTATGLATIRNNFSNQLLSSVIPIDFAPFCRRFLRHYRIRHGVIMETELWPELLQQAALEEIPLVLVNARLSSKTSGNWLATALLKKTVNHFARILCRFEADREQFLSLDANPAKLSVLGNLKAASSDTASFDQLVEPPYLLLASSHDPEEAEFLKQRPQDRNLPLLVIVPRHPDRSANLQIMMRELEIRFAVRSLQEKITRDTEVYLADTLGELQAFMQHASLVVMGGSFDGTGGHNLHEPARLGKAIITGPSDSNIRDDIQLLGPNEGIIQVDSIASGWDTVLELLDSPQRAQRLGENARQRSAQQSELLSRYSEAIDQVISP